MSFVRGGNRQGTARLLWRGTAVRIWFKIALSCLGIAALVGVVGWRSGVTNDAVRAEVEHIAHSSVRELMGATDMLLALEATRSAAQQCKENAPRPGGGGNVVQGNKEDQCAGL